MDNKQQSKPPPQVPRVTLNDGVQMPALGFGTSGVRLGERHDDDQAAYEAIRFAIDCGYRFFDTAALYMNEPSVGRAVNDAIRAGQVARDELFICTKVWNTDHERPAVVRACRDSLARLQLDYADLYLIHWPMGYKADSATEGGASKTGNRPAGPIVVNPRDEGTGRLAYSDTHFTETWLGMEDAKEAGLARSIGLSNFSQPMIDELLHMPGLRHKPSLLQTELHPYLAQTELHDYCRRHNIVLNAYCPLGAPGASWAPAQQPRVIDEPLIGAIARRHRKSRAQIILRYHLQRSIVPIPKSNNRARIRENLAVFDFELDAGELRQLLALDRNLRYCRNTAGEFPTDHPLYPFRERHG